jgi:hypothetical protein
MNWLPIFATVLPISLFMMGAGDWGQKQHPVIHGWVSSELFRSLYYPWLIRFLPFGFFAIYVSLFFQRRISKVEVACSLVLYTICIGAFWFFAFLLSGLASQGAGH